MDSDEAKSAKPTSDAQPNRLGAASLTLRKQAVFTLVILVILVGLAELGARAFSWAIGRMPYSETNVWYSPDEELLYTLRPGYEGLVSEVFQTTARINRHGRRGEDFPAHKPQGTWRILCLGDSRTFGLEVGEGLSYPAHLQRMAAERTPDQRIHVINAGTIGYTSYQGLRDLEHRALRFAPDVVTVAFGYNDRRFVLRADQADGAAWFRRVARGMQWRDHLNFSYALMGLGEAWRRLLGTRSWEEQVLELPSQRLDDLACRVDEEPYRRNLLGIVALCRSRRIPVVMLVMGDTSRVAEPFRRGQALREQGRYEAALEAFRRFDQDLPDPSVAGYFRALSFYEIAKTLEALGRTDEAAQSFRLGAQAAAKSSVFGGALVRHVDDYIRIAHEVAETQGLPVVDIERRFHDRPELYPDHCHFTTEGHRLIAEALFDCLEDNRLLGR